MRVFTSRFGDIGRRGCTAWGLRAFGLWYDFGVSELLGIGVVGPRL